MNLAPITVAVHTLGRNTRQDLLEDVRAGLAADPKTLPPRWFYDDAGCDLFEQITDLPEYYQTRTEMEILRRHAREIVGMAPSASIVELGAGSCTKSRVLIQAAKGAGTLLTFVPFDISETTIRRSAAELVEEYDDLTIYCVAGEFDKHLAQIPRLGSQLIVFLGSTIGNFTPAETSAFLASVRSLMRPGDSFLLGMDLVKPQAELLAAYDDAAGVTGRFNLNILARIKRELGARFDLDSFEHQAIWNAQESRIEMHLRSRRDQVVPLGDVGGSARFRAGETIRTEICTKYTRAGAVQMLELAGLLPKAWFTDPAESFALVLAV